MKNVLIVHDISCYGRCSTTVALPIISSMELQGTLLPTSLLSTHTGPGFTGYTYLDLSGEMPKIVNHWKSFGLKFDAVYVGYLGAVEQIDFLCQTIPDLLKPEGHFYLDPVMADNGAFYKGFDQAYADEMVNLCRLADVIMPNQTEASFLYGLPYEEGMAGLDLIPDLIEKINQDSPTSLVLTGAGRDGQGRNGAYYFDAGDQSQGLVQADQVGDSYHGTGDIFGSILVGALENDASLAEATQLAVDSIPRIISCSLDDPHLEQNGLQFERILGDLSSFARRQK